MFDQELIAQVVAAGMGRRIGEIAVPTRYFDEASSVGFKRSVVYGLSTLRVVLRYLLHRARRPPLPEAHGADRRAAPAGRLSRAPARPDAAADLPREPLLGGGDLARRARRSSCAASTSQETADVLRTADSRWIAVGFAFVIADLADARRCAGSASSRPIQAVRYLHMLGYLLVGYLLNNILPARLGELVRSHYLGDREGISRTSALGTVVVERVVDLVAVVAIASVVAPRPERPGRRRERGPRRARRSPGCSSSSWRSGSSPTACRAPTGSATLAERWPRVRELGAPAAGRARASPAGRGRSSRRFACSAVSWSLRDPRVRGRRPVDRRSSCRSARRR